jgi:hypothetical protein
MLNLYRDRLGDFELDTKVAQIRAVGEVGAAELKGETEQSLDRLNIARNEMLAAEEHLRAFRTLHDLDYPAYFPKSGADTAWRWAILVLLLIAEMLMNGIFFARGNDFGLVGGWGTAGFFAFFNIALAFFAGRYASTAVHRREPLYRLFGWSGLAVYGIGAAFLNLTIAHYRSASEADSADPGVKALENLAQGLFHGLDMMSMALLGLGLVFSIIALIDARKMGDAYLGYERPARLFEDRRQYYEDDRRDAVDSLTGIYRKTVEEMKETQNDLGRRRGEGAAIHEAILRVVKSYEAKLRELERAGNRLLSIYREANREARSSPAPAYFSRPWTLPRVEYSEVRGPRYTEAELSRIIDEAKAELDAQMTRLNGLFESAMQRLKSLDSLDS